jgi:hypothetical protein
MPAGAWAEAAAQVSRIIANRYSFLINIFIFCWLIDALLPGEAIDVI